MPVDSFCMQHAERKPLEGRDYVMGNWGLRGLNMIVHYKGPSPVLSLSLLMLSLGLASTFHLPCM